MSTTTISRLWPGETCVCIAGGPSLTPADVEATRGRARVIAINDAYRLAPWADVMYACDETFWRWQFRFHREAIESFEGLKVSLDLRARRWPNVQILNNTGDSGLELQPTGLRTGRNSGYQAINLAAHFGVARILLLGYDMRLGDDGRSHWFGEHPDRRRPPLSMFRRHFGSIVSPLDSLGITVLNCSRKTALKAFPTADLQTALPAREQEAVA